MRQVDLVVVGGGPSGISTALHVHAAAPGLSLLVLEKERYPREKICAGGIGARAFRILDKLGVTIECPMVKLDAIALRLGGETIVTHQKDLGVVVRRVEFDHALANQAIARGIEVRDGCAVETIAVGDDGVQVTTAGGEQIRARAIVGADGIGGIVRRQTGFPRGELRAQAVELDTEGVTQDLPRDTIVFDFDARDLNGYTWDFPTLVGGAPMICRGAYVIRNLGPDDARARIATYLTARGLDPKRYRHKQFAERGFEPGAEISIPRVLLVGEAAGIDIATGEGIGQAIEYGAIAGPYLARAFAADRLRFSDWQSTVHGHHLGRQLRIRHAAYRWLFGPRRATVERVLPQLPALFRVAVQDFAGVPMSKLALLRGAGQFLAAVSREKMRD
ncbi:MAG: NAD(P)/FAD-dependent oxidoreductase [Deltaproteobacteria bacterium]|nr:NAD(P)/FAD-dependent oxidoreductase [Deltaproteobacteria bacterium]